MTTNYQLVNSIYKFIRYTATSNTMCALGILYINAGGDKKRRLPCIGNNSETIVKCSHCVFSEVDVNFVSTIKIIEENQPK